jgi:predicted nucleic acid-binding protein
MAYLLDTDILSAIRRRQRDVNLEKWFTGNRTAEIYLSVVTVGEIERGITRQKSIDPEFALTLNRWLETIITRYGQRILPLTASIARRWGQLSGELGHNGADLMIAATALEHNLTIVTRNTRHFEPAKVNLINPFLAA